MDLEIFPEKYEQIYRKLYAKDELQVLVVHNTVAQKIPAQRMSREENLSNEIRVIVTSTHRKHIITALENTIVKDVSRSLQIEINGNR